MAIDRKVISDSMVSEVFPDEGRIEAGLKYFKDAKTGTSSDDTADIVHDVSLETHVVIDINIDGVQLYKNGKAPQVIPILGRVYSIGGYVVPIKEADPFVIGLYHGHGKPTTRTFLKWLIDEMNRLEKGKGVGYDGRKLSVEVRCFICDTPMRAWLKGVVGHTGYFACERCCVRGTRKKTGGGIAYCCMTAHSRTDRNWGSYMRAQVNALDRTHTHRRRRTPLSKTYIGKKMISAFIMDSMHIIDGGVCIDAPMWIFGIGTRKSKRKRITAEVSLSDSIFIR